MSFGFGVGDFLAVSQLAWNLYRYCYVVARGAPHEFQLLVQEITALSQSIKLLELEAQDPNSTLVRSGEDRVRMVKEMMSRVEVTLKELEKHAKKYEKLGDSSRSKRQQLWAKFKWSTDASDLDALRNKLVYHNGVINLLLTSCGNSSLQRIESSNQRLERRFSQIGDLVQKIGSQSSSDTPAISSVNHKSFKTSLLSAKLMENAEVGRRRWSAIGVDEWIQAGRWWLLKSQSDLSADTSSDGHFSHHIYTNLIKASWILIDVIAKHPQLNLLDPSIRYDAEVLAEAIRGQLEDLDSSGLPKPTFEDILACDLSIWETQAKGAPLHPSKRDSKSGLVEERHRSWETKEEQVLFQRFAHYQASKSSISTSCVILFAAHKGHKRASIVVRDQSWTTLATFEVGDTFPMPDGKIISIGDQEIMSPTCQDAQYLSVLWEAIGEHVLHRVMSDHDHDALMAIVLLCAIRRGYGELVASLLRDMQRLDREAEHSTVTSSIELRTSAMELASSSFSGERVASISPASDMGLSLLLWAAESGHDEVVMYLLKQKGIFSVQRPFRLSTSIHEHIREGWVEMIILLSTERGFRVDTRNKDGYTGLQTAAEGGHEAMVDKLLQAGADVNAPPSEHSGLTALQAAAQGGHEAVVDKLLQAGADVNAPPSRISGLTALQAAAQGGHEAVVDRLLQAGADVNAPLSGYEGLTALQAAAQGGHEAVVDKLLQAGADVNAPPSEYSGLTALQAAARGGHEAVVDRLLQAGADVNAPPAEYYGLTALQAAAEGGHKAVTKMLLLAGARSD